LHESGIAVRIVDSRTEEPSLPPGVQFLRCDVAQQKSELSSAIATSDCVCVCLPEKLTLDLLPWLPSVMPQGSLWLDTLSVKSQVAHGLEAHASRLEILSINPMFAPGLGWKGNAVAAVNLSPGPKAAFFQQLLSAWGARLEHVTAQEHDRLTAALQVATHAAVLSFGATLLELNPDLEKLLRLATPPSRLLLALLDRIASQNSEVYWDIQAFHPLGGQTRAYLLDSVRKVDSAAHEQNAQGFTALFSQLRALLEPSAALLQQWSKQLAAQAAQLALDTAPR
jgi:4-amino-4-deoxyprephenate dehydrogenase